MHAPGLPEPVVVTGSTATAGLAGPATPRWLTLLWAWAPAAPALLMAVMLLVAYQGDAHGLRGALLCVAAALAVGLRFHHPPLAWAVSLTVVPLAMVESAGDLSVFTLMVLVPILPLAAVSTAWPVARSLAVATINVLVMTAIGVATSGEPAGNLLIVAIGLPALATAAAWLVGYSLRTRAQYAASLEARARDLERERDARSARAVADERVRIARDLHDLVSHNVAVMVVQAEAADVVWDNDPVRAREALRAVAETGRAAMGELRTMLHAMRVGDDPEGGDDTAERRAQQGLRSLPRVVEQVRAAGQRTELTVDGDLGVVPSAVDGSLLRIVQEALTNVLRHAAAETAWVTVRVADDAVTVTVEDDGVGVDGTATGDALDPLRRGGHGLIGIRERTAVMGGTLGIDRGPRGGTRVAVRVPLAGASDQPASDRRDRQAPTA